MHNNKHNQGKGQQKPSHGKHQQPYGQSSQPNSNVQIMSRGMGINDNECQTIITSCIEVYSQNLAPLSNRCIQKIKEKIKGEWFIFVCPDSETNYDFYLSFVDGGKYLTFKYGTNEFHVCGIKNRN